jgi:nucleolar protein 6
LEACIKNFHHSKLDDGKTAPRKINVELTVGGGGSGKSRKSKIRAKNERLVEERKKAGKSGQKGDAKEDGDDKDVKAVEERSEDNHIHPSRRAKVSM